MEAFSKSDPMTPPLWVPCRLVLILSFGRAERPFRRISWLLFCVVFRRGCW